MDLAMKMVCLCVSNGETFEETASKVGVSLKEVQAIIARPSAQDLIVRYQAANNPTIIGRVKKLAQVALDVQTRLLLSADTSDTVKARVAQEVIDRAEGKAIQVTENRNLNFDLKSAEVIDKQMAAQMMKLHNIEQMRKKLAVPISANLIKES